MQNFETVRDAFEWWIKNVYPNLSPSVKKGKPVTAWRDYTHNRGISEERMKNISIEFGSFEIKTIIRHKP